MHLLFSRTVIYTEMHFINYQSHDNLPVTQLKLLEYGQKRPRQNFAVDSYKIHIYLIHDYHSHIIVMLATMEAMYTSWHIQIQTTVQFSIIYIH